MMDEDALCSELAWQSELIDVMFPVVTSAYNLMEERAQDHNGAVCPVCLGRLAEALHRWNEWLHVAGGEHKGEEAVDGR
jgi:hypothetical protein